MNKYKIEFKQIFNRLVTIYAEDEEQAMKVVEQTYLKTDLLDDNEKDLVGIEAKILEKNGEKVDRKEEIPENFENFLDAEFISTGLRLIERYAQGGMEILCNEVFEEKWDGSKLIREYKDYDADILRFVYKERMSTPF